MNVRKSSRISQSFQGEALPKIFIGAENRVVDESKLEIYDLVIQEKRRNSRTSLAHLPFVEILKQAGLDPVIS